MASSPESKAVRQRMQRIETLIQEADRFPDPVARARTKEIVQAILDLHGAGLEAILEHVAAAGETGQAMIDGLARDDLVGSLLLLYGLHPLDVETRVRQALDKVRSSLRSHDGGVELLGVSEGVVRLRILGGRNGTSVTAVTLKPAIEEAIYELAPDVTAIEVEGMTETREQENGRALFALPLLQH